MATNSTNDTKAIAEIQKKLADASLAPPGTGEPANPTDSTNEETKVEESTADGSASSASTESTISTTITTQPPSVNASQAPPKADAYPTPQQPVQEDTKAAETDRTNLIINYLPPTMSEGTLATLFSPYGLLERCKIVVDLQTLRSRGYGFVKYDNASSAERALKALNGYELNGKRLKVAFARQQCKAITNANLYITNIPAHYEDDNLRKLFRDYGTIVECRVLKDQHGQSRGVGFVRMDTHHNAIQALQAMDQYVIDDKHPPLLVKLAQRRVPRRYWNTQNRGQNTSQGGRGGKSGMQMNGNNNRGKNKRGNQNRRYAPKGQGGQGAYRQQPNQMGMVGAAMGMDGTAYGAHQMSMQQQYPAYQQQQPRGSPKSRGYYRPRNQGGKQPKPQYQPRRQANQAQGAQPMYAQPMAMYAAEPYAMYGQQPAYGQPMVGHMAAMPTGSAPSNVAQNGMAMSSSMMMAVPASVGASVQSASVGGNGGGPSQQVSGSSVTGLMRPGGQMGAGHMLTVLNLPKHFDVGHLMNMYAKFGPVQSVKILEDREKGPTGVVSYFYKEDALRAQNETNRQQIGSSEPALETIMQAAVSPK